MIKMLREMKSISCENGTISEFHSRKNPFVCKEDTRRTHSSTTATTVWLVSCLFIASDLDGLPSGYAHVQELLKKRSDIDYSLSATQLGTNYTKPVKWTRSAQ